MIPTCMYNMHTTPMMALKVVKLIYIVVLEYANKLNISSPTNFEDVGITIAFYVSMPHQSALCHYVPIFFHTSLQLCTGLSVYIM